MTDNQGGEDGYQSRQKNTRARSVVEKWKGRRRGKNENQKKKDISGSANTKYAKPSFQGLYGEVPQKLHVLTDIQYRGRYRTPRSLRVERADQESQGVEFGKKKRN